MHEFKKDGKMKKKWMIYMSLVFVCTVVSNVVADLADVEQKLNLADKVWLDGAVETAVAQYDEILSSLPKDAEPFRATVIMRLARARLAAGDKAGCITTLDLLTKMDYVPEHHALSAEELKAVIAGKPHPGQQRTEIPAVGKVDKTFYVDAKAQPDVGNGSVDNPFSTVHEAIYAARLHIRRSQALQTVEILLESGDYLVKTPIRLARPDSGMQKKPFVLRSRDAKNPAVLTGGVTLTNWSILKDGSEFDRLPELARGKVMVCDLSAHGIPSMGELVFGGFSSMRAEPHNHRFNTMPVPELFYKSEVQTLARWPNDKLARIPVNEKPKSELDRFQRWAQEDDLWLYGYWNKDWADAYEKVASIEADGTIRVAPPVSCYGFNRRKGCAINALCELDRSGEWYLDVKGNRVFYWPPADFDTNQCILSAFGAVIEGDHASYIQLRDLDIRYVRGDAVILSDCSDVVMAGVNIRNCSGNGIKIHGGKRHLIHSCSVGSMGRGAIDLWAGDWQNLISSQSVVENCRISNLSRIDRTYTPALLIDGMGIKVRYCSFENIPSSAIRVEACDALIELNSFKRCVYESGDQGAIDMWANPLYRGNIIRWNDFDSITNPHAHYGAAAVRCDDYISGFMIVQNVMRKGSPRGFGAVQFNEGTDSYVEGNIIVDWKNAFSGCSSVGSQWTSHITGHPNSKRMLAETDWQGQAWRQKYPMVRDLLNGNNNHNYLVGNLRMGNGSWGGVGRAISLANRVGDTNVHGNKLADLKPFIAPWYPIPIDLIGPYTGD